MTLSQLAKSLTKAQREAVMGAFVVERQAAYRNGRIAIRAHGKVLYNLRRARLLEDYIGSPLLTPLGLALRAHLKGQSDADA